MKKITRATFKSFVNKNGGVKMRSNPRCPVCGANLIYRRRSKEELKIVLKDGNSIIIDENERDGSTEIYCSEDRTHEIGSITSYRVKRIIWDFGF